MKNFLLPVVILALVSCSSVAQNGGDHEDIKRTLESYLKAGDHNNVDELNNYIHDHFRVALYDGMEDIAKVLDKTTYTTLIGNKTFGGYPRTVEYGAIDTIGENMASIQVTLTSPGKPTLKNFYSLVKTGGKWTVIQDFVVLIP
ncbi:MAG: nuclear transport factor 2 family protein [Bacteroidota bacterium]